MNEMCEQMKKWNKDIEIVDMSQVYVSRGGYGSYGDEDDEEHEAEMKKIEQQVREQFMTATNAGMQAQMNKRFIDREVMRRLQENH